MEQSVDKSATEVDESIKKPIDIIREYVREQITEENYEYWQSIFKVIENNDISVEVTLPDSNIISEYSIQRLLTTGWAGQQYIVLEDDFDPHGNQLKAIRVLIEGEDIPINIFFFKKKLKQKIRDKDNIYSQPGIDELKELLFPFLNKETLKKARLPDDVNEIGMVIFPNSTYNETNILNRTTNARYWSPVIAFFHKKNEGGKEIKRTDIEMKELLAELNRVKIKMNSLSSTASSTSWSSTSSSSSNTSRKQLLPSLFILKKTKSKPKKSVKKRLPKNQKSSKIRNPPHGTRKSSRIRNSL